MSYFRDLKFYFFVRDLSTSFFISLKLLYIDDRITSQHSHKSVNILNDRLFLHRFYTLGEKFILFFTLKVSTL